MDMSEENDAELTQQLVSVQVSLEKYADALENADSLLEQEPANIAVRELRVDALMELDREDEAEEERERIGKLQPELAATGEPAATEFAEAAP